MYNVQHDAFLNRYSNLTIYKVVLTSLILRPFKPKVYSVSGIKLD